MLSVVLAMLLQAPVVTGDRSVVSKCEVADDPEYGYTMARPIKVGGTPMFGPRRQQRYLQALAGPAGQPITFVRRGATAPDADRIILDRYELMYDGLDKPIELYLDLYRWEPPKAPKGLLCGAAIGLELPPPSPFDRPDPSEARLTLAEAAIARMDETLPVIPLEPGSLVRGMAFDPLRLLALAARDASRRGAPLTPDELAAIETPGLLVVANPADCGGARAAAASVTFTNSRGQVLQPSGALITGTALKAMLPGLDLEEGAAGAAFMGQPFVGSLAMTYEGTACGGEPVVLPLTAGPPQRTAGANPGWPAGVRMTQSTVVVRVRATIDLDGVPRDPEVIDGPSDFALAAVDTVRQWRYRPVTVNGAPVFVPVTMTLTVTFRSR